MLVLWVSLMRSSFRSGLPSLEIASMFFFMLPVSKLMNSSSVKHSVLAAAEILNSLFQMETKLAPVRQPQSESSS